MGKCVFNQKWCTTYPWVTKAEDKFKAYCKVCRKIIDLSKMGEGALRSHEKAEKHRLNTRLDSDQRGLESFVLPSPPPSTSTSSSSTSSDTSSSTSSHAAASGQKQMCMYFAKNDVLTSEILWTMQTVVNHNSYKSNENISELFKTMFPDSKIAEKFTCGERKTAYFTVFGIAEYLRSLIINDIKSYFVIMFDESLNKKSQSNQMDFHVRYWKGDKVITHYLGSVFMGHGKASDLLEHFNKGMQDLQPVIRNMVQISMDGPSVNWKFFDIVKKQLADEHGVILINIGSCGLHIMHSAFKTGAQSTKWEISSFLSSLYYLFKDSPARREDFQKITGWYSKIIESLTLSLAVISQTNN